MLSDAEKRGVYDQYGHAGLDQQSQGGGGGAGNFGDIFGDVFGDIFGGSGGGTLTAWIVGKTDRFRAAVSVNPVINWASQSLTSDIDKLMANYWFADLPWDNPMVYWSRSPLSLVGNVTTPTMLITGEEDWRTPIWEAEQYFNALQVEGVDTALVRVPGASHWIEARPSHLIAKVNAILAWFERYSKPTDASIEK